MNNLLNTPQRERKKHLYIVEGHHERDKFIQLFYNSFPLMNTDQENIIIYGTNIYQLYEKIVREYTNSWELDDVDLPFTISGENNEEKLYKINFTSIIIIFDYERHDPYFSENKIMKMQNYFNDATDVSQLYINYPMIESYLHLDEIPDRSYSEKLILVKDIPNGSVYKNIVKDLHISKLFNFKLMLNDLLKINYNITDDFARNIVIENLLNINTSDNLVEKIEIILANYFVN